MDTDANGEFLFTNLPVAFAPAPPNPEACYLVNYDLEDPELTDCTVPLLDEDNLLMLTTDNPDAEPTVFANTLPEAVAIPINSPWALLLLTLSFLFYARRTKAK